MGRYPILLLAVLALAGCDSDLLRPPPPTRGAQLTGEQINLALSGNSLVQDEAQPPPLVLFFAENGELRGIRSNHYQDRGSWRVENDRVCGKWNNWHGTLASCWAVYRSGNRLSLTGERSTDVLFASLAVGNVADLQ
jgi:hypothetical protein